MTEILIPMAGMLFVLSLVFGSRFIAMLDNYFKSKQLAGVDELMEIRDRLDQLDNLEERMRVVEAVITDENYQLKKQFDELERGSR
jgi:hypothetical protein